MMHLDKINDLVVEVENHIANGDYDYAEECFDSLSDLLDDLDALGYDQDELSEYNDLIQHLEKKVYFPEGGASKEKEEPDSYEELSEDFM